MWEQDKVLVDLQDLLNRYLKVQKMLLAVYWNQAPKWERKINIAQINFQFSSKLDLFGHDAIYLWKLKAEYMLIVVTTTNVYST